MTEELVREGRRDIPSLPGLKFSGNQDWREYAACAKLPKNLFFYEGRGAKGNKELLDSVNVCLKCPVRRQCLEFAVKNNEPYGQWAGTFPDERAKMHKEYLATGIVGTPSRA